VNQQITKTSRILSVYHLFLHCQEISYQEFALNFGVSQRTALRDIRLLQQAGVLEARWDRARQAFVPVTLEPFPMEVQENKTRQKYLEKLRRLCILMRRMSWEDYEDGTNKVELYRELFPNTPDRTRQRDFKELEQLGYEVWYERGFEDEPGRWHYDIPSAYGLATIPGMRC
jgi:predicted DNA-binding transcriptional regulator YafY